MRDYTRKAKIKDSNEWVIGYHVYVDYLDKHYILVSEKTHDGFSGMLEMKQYEVDGDTICNPTGLTDKNGNMIWENDVVKCNYNDYGEKGTYIGKVIFREDTCTFIVTDGKSTDYEWWNEEKEVIGNVFDNPDLLKGE